MTNDKQLQFSLGSLMLLVALAALGLGLLREVIAVGVAFFLAAIPALARTWRLGAEGRAAGRPLGKRAQSATFVRSLALVLSVVGAALLVLACLSLVACLAALSATIWCARLAGAHLVRTLAAVRWSRRMALVLARRSAAADLALVRRF